MASLDASNATMKTVRRHTDSTATRILNSIHRRGRGSVFVPADFLGIDSVSRDAVDAALGRLVDAGTIRRLARGVYDFPMTSRFGPRTPSPDSVANAVARSTNEKVVVSDAKAANMLGLSTQVPAQAVYLTTGTNRVVPVNVGDGAGFDIRFKRVSPSRMLGANSKAGLVLRALNFLGQSGANDNAQIQRLRAVLGDDDLRQLRNLRPQATGWKRQIIDSIVGGVNMSMNHKKTATNSAASPVA